MSEFQNHLFARCGNSVKIIVGSCFVMVVFFLLYRFTRDQIISIRTRDMWYLIYSSEKATDEVVTFGSLLTAKLFPISYIWKFFNMLLKHWSIRLWKSKQIIDMRNKHIETYDYLRISYKNGRSRIWFLPFLSISYFKVNPLWQGPAS